MRNNLKCSCFLLRNLGLLFFFFQSLTITVLQQIGKVHDHQYRVLLCTFIRMLSYFPQDVSQHAPDFFRIFSGLFENIPRNVSGMFGDISRNVWGHSLKCFGTFPGMFGDIPPIPCVPRIRLLSNSVKYYRHYLICKFDFTCQLFFITYKLTSDKRNHLNFKGNFYYQTLFNIFISTPLIPNV